jgi:hypothetical protein
MSKTTSCVQLTIRCPECGEWKSLDSWGPYMRKPEHHIRWGHEFCRSCKRANDKKRKSA